MSKELIISQKQIESWIYTIRGVQVMLDADLAEIYQTKTKYINRALKRNPDRFPEEFAFQLSLEEWTKLKFQSGTSSGHGGRRTEPYVFTEQGIAMLSAVLQTKVAIHISVQIMKAFIEMRKILQNNLAILQRVESVEKRQLITDKKLEQVLKALEGENIPTQGVFFDGQIFDAYELASKIIRSAQENIVLIDNYIDETTLTHLSKKKKGVKVILLSKNISKQLNLDIKKANEQYGNFEAKTFVQSHDRFLIIDSKEVYHLGASLKDLGRKWFAFSMLETISVEKMIENVKLIMDN